MTIRFVLMVNKQGQTRLAQYYERFSKMDERCALESEVIRKCLSRTDVQCSFYEYRGYKVVYRRYASLFFIVGVEGEDENELSILEFIHALVETLDANKPLISALAGIVWFGVLFGVGFRILQVQECTNIGISVINCAPGPYWPTA